MALFFHRLERFSVDSVVPRISRIFISPDYAREFPICRFSPFFIVSDQQWSQPFSFLLATSPPFKRQSDLVVTGFFDLPLLSSQRMIFSSYVTAYLSTKEPFSSLLCSWQVLEFQVEFGPQFPFSFCRIPSFLFFCVARGRPPTDLDSLVKEYGTASSTTVFPHLVRPPLLIVASDLGLIGRRDSLLGRSPLALDSPESEVGCSMRSRR